MRGINKAIILGNLGADPQSVTFQNGNQQENTQWHKVRLSGK